MSIKSIPYVPAMKLTSDAIEDKLEITFLGMKALITRLDADHYSLVTKAPDKGNPAGELATQGVIPEIMCGKALGIGHNPRLVAERLKSLTLDEVNNCLASLAEHFVNSPENHARWQVEDQNRLAERLGRPAAPVGPATAQPVIASEKGAEIA